MLNNIEHNNDLKEYKVIESDKTTFYHYKEKFIYVNFLSYLWFYNLCFGTYIICYNVSHWFFYKVNLKSYNDLSNLLLVILWLFIMKIGFEMLTYNKVKVQILDKVEIVDNKGNKQIIKV